MAEQSEHSAATRSKLARTRLPLGAAAAAIGLFVALGWLGLPGIGLSLNQDGNRTDSIAALGQANHQGSHRKAGLDPIAETSHAGRGAAPAHQGRAQAVKAATPRSAGKRLQPSPRPKQPGVPSAGNPQTVSEGNDSGSTTPPAAEQVSTPPSPLSSPLSPVDVPQLPGVPTPQVPTLP
jgi:hypothetical protein